MSCRTLRALSAAVAVLVAALHPVTVNASAAERVAALKEAATAKASSIESTYESVFNSGEDYGDCTAKEQCGDNDVCGTSDVSGEDCACARNAEYADHTVTGWELPENQPYMSTVCPALRVPSGAEDHDDFGLVKCCIRNLESSYQDSYTENPDFYLQYYGDQRTGLSQFFPGRKGLERNCPSTYDPRLRPWYSAAASGPKDVIIIIDTSGSMTMGNNRMLSAKNAALAVLKTLNWADRASVIGFASEVTKMSDTLLPVNGANRALMQDFVNGLAPNGKTNYEVAFSEAFNQMEATKKAGETTGCNSVILFLTDGSITEGMSGGGLVDKVSDELNHDDFDMRIFTFTFGDDDIGHEAKDLACRNKGIYQHIPDDEADQLSTKMANYYMYFAAGLDSSQVRMSEVYDSSSSGLQMFTGAVPVYDRTTDPPTLFGVVAVDVLTANMVNESDYESVLAENYEAASVCVSLSLTEDQIESLRKQIGEDSLCHDHGGAVVAIVIGVLFGFLLIVVGICWCVKRRKSKAQAPPVTVVQQPMPVAQVVQPQVVQGVPMQPQMVQQQAVPMQPQVVQQQAPPPYQG